MEVNDYAARATHDLGELERLSQSLLKLGGITRPPTPDNLIALFDPGRNIVVASRPLKEIRGILQPEPQRWIVITNSKLPYPAQRFSRFHEGFHILRRSGKFLSNGNDEYQEWLADQFAARILMPRRWVIEALVKTQEVRQLCAIFKVSQKAMTKRLRELNL